MLYSQMTMESVQLTSLSVRERSHPSIDQQRQHQTALSSHVRVY